MKSRKENSLRYFQDVEGIEPEIYYHYTSLSALYSIITTQSFWLVNLKSSNDKKELTYSFSQFKNDYSKIISSENDQNRKGFLQMAEESFLGKEMIRDARMPNKDSYGLCLCRKRDNLTHWDRYTGNCKGVSIAVNTRALDILYLRMNVSFIASHLFECNGIVYSEEDRIQYINKTIDRITERLLGIKEGRDLSVFLPTFIPLAYTDIKNFVKVDSFFDEDEVRLYYCPKSLSSIRKIITIISSQLEDDSELGKNLQKNFEKMIDDLKIEETKYHLFEKGIRSYHQLCLKKIWGDGLIPEITLGPMCTQDKKELRAFLNAHGLRGTKITESKVPIR